MKLHAFATGAGTYLARSNGREYPLPPPDHKFYIHGISYAHDNPFVNSFTYDNPVARGNPIDIPMRPDQQYTPRTLPSDAWMDEISASSPSDSSSFDHEDNALLEDMDHLYPDCSAQEDLGEGFFPEELAIPSGGKNVSLDALTTFASLLDSGLPQVRSLGFVVSNADAALRINEAIEKLRNVFPELAGLSRLSARVNDTAPVEDHQWDQIDSDYYWYSPSNSSASSSVSSSPQVVN